MANGFVIMKLAKNELAKNGLWRVTTIIFTRVL